MRVVDLRDYPMPIMDLDLEARDGLPPKAREMREHMMWSADAPAPLRVVRPFADRGATL